MGVSPLGRINHVNATRASKKILVEVGLGGGWSHNQGDPKFNSLGVKNREFRNVNLTT